MTQGSRINGCQWRAAPRALSQDGMVGSHIQFIHVSVSGPPSQNTDQVTRGRWRLEHSVVGRTCSPVQAEFCYRVCIRCNEASYQQHPIGTHAHHAGQPTRQTPPNSPMHSPFVATPSPGRKPLGSATRRANALRIMLGALETVPTDQHKQFRQVQESRV